MNIRMLNSTDEVKDVKINDNVILVAKSNDEKESSLVDYIKGQVSNITNAFLYIKIENKNKSIRILKKRVIEVKVN